MSILTYSTCRIQFTLNNKQNPEREYSERSVVALLHNDNQGFSLRATDVEHNNREIFNLPIKARDQYQFGLSVNQPDEINDSNGTYRLWLKAESRDEFHQLFCAVIEALFPENSNPTTSPSNLYTFEETKSSLPSMYYSEPAKEKKASLPPMYYPEPSKEKKAPVPDPVNCNPKDMLTDVRNLCKFIQQGRADEAARLTKKFISQGIHLEAKSLKQYSNEEEFQINIQFDGNEYSINQNGGAIPMNVFPSTTIRELRAAFEIAYQYPPANQYFFVNGKIAHDNSTMRDLNVGPNSLFVLFLLAYPKQFKAQGPWKCSACFTQNQQDNLKCRICLASRIE